MSDELVLEIDPPYIGSAVSPTVDITETPTDVTVTITDFQGDHAYTIEKTDQAIAYAEQAASNANTAAANATSTANQAAQYARDTADQAAADAQETADAAAGRADTAAGDATSAAQAATQAAGTANTSAQNADTKAALADSKAALADQAATTANQAAQAAEAAKTAANTAAGQATTAATNATTAAQTATTAAGNADAKAQLADTAATNADTATQAANTATTNATNAAQAANNAADVAIAAAEDMPRLIGTVDTVQTIADAWPTTLEGATLYGKCVQDGTPTPSNPVPVQVVGSKNMLDPANSILTANYAYYGRPASGLTPFRLEPGTYTLSTSDGVITSALYVYEHTSGGTEQNVSTKYNASSNTFTISEAKNVFCTGYWANADRGERVLQLEHGTQATPYTPYGCIGLQTGETVHAIDLQGHTLAGGDVLKVDSAGRVWIDAGAKKVTGNSFGVWSVNLQSDGTVSFSVATDAKTSTTPMSNVAYVGGPNTGKLVVSGTTIYMRFSQSVVGTTSEQIKSWLAANCELYYESTATPQTIELGTITPPSIAPGDTLAIYASLDPEWAIEYTQDPSIVVNTLQSSIAPVEGSTASANYSVGAYLVHANQLYRVTSAIATGEAIEPGSNCVTCTVMGELARLTA